MPEGHRPAGHDPDEARPPRSARLDRVRAPAPGLARRRDTEGKEALYSTGPSATPTSQLLVHCRRCDVEAGMSVLGFARQLIPPPVLINPLNRRLYARCPTCQRRSWLNVRHGQQLRALLDRRPTR